jgi:hypothetical protein
MTQIVQLNSSFSLAAGQTVTFSDPTGSPGIGDPAYLLYPILYPMKAPPITFYVAGDLEITDDRPFGVTGIVDSFYSDDPVVVATFTAGSRVTIASTGTLTVTESAVPYGTPVTTAGYFSNRSYMSFENDGAVTVSTVSGLVYGVGMVGTMTPAHPTVVNTGAIQVSGTSGAAVAAGGDYLVGDDGGVSVTNSGSILAQGGPVGILVGPPLNPSFASSDFASLNATITNTGHVTATGGSSPTVGIGVNPALAGLIDITSSGTVTADHAVEVFANHTGLSGTAVVNLHNSGTLQGSVVVDSGSYDGVQIFNSGAIVGAVQLLNTADHVYDGRGGTLSGTLALGGGHYAIYLGADGETVHGGAGGGIIVGGTGIDHITGGAGNDLIDGGGSGGGDMLHGGTGGDVLDGGGGINTISFQSEPGDIGVSLLEQNGYQDIKVNHWVSLSNFQNLIGSTHNDILLGDNNDNVIDGGGGNDVMDGLGGTNTASFASAATGVTVSLALQGSAQATGVGSDTLSDFQNLIGSAFSDHLTGDANGNLIDGDGGDDVLDGGGGTNTVTFASARSGVTVSLALQGQAQVTGVGTDTLSNFQNLVGSAFNDVLAGDSGNNTIDGGGGANTVSYASAGAAVTVDLSGGTATGAASGADTLFNIQSVIGSAFDDDLIVGGQSGRYDGGGGINTLDFRHANSVVIDLAQGLASNLAISDTLANIQNVIGSNENDRIIFGTASGDATGGLGADTFIYRPGDGNDVITDFTHTQGDKIDLSAFSFVQSLQDVKLAASQQSADTVIALPGSGSLTLQGVTLSTLSNGDFLFGSGSHLNQDINGDHQADIIFRNPSTGDWGYAAMTAQGYDWHHFGNSGVNYAVAGEGDFNGDGIPDVLFRDPSTGDWGYAAMNATGYTWVHLGNSGVPYTVAGTGDFNHDGRSDVLFRDAATGDWGYAAMTAQGYTWVHLGNSGVDYEVVGTGDFNGDGRTDALFRDNATGDWGYAAMTAQGFDWHHFGNSGVNYAVAGTGDFNGDGYTDVLFRDPSTGDWGYAAMNPQGYTWVHLGNSGADYTVAGTGDFNGDGRADVVFRDASTGDWGYAAMTAAGYNWVHIGVSSTDYLIS